MRQKDQDDGTATALPVTLELYLDGTPANDTAARSAVDRAGPLGLARAYWVLWGGMLLNRLGGTVFFLLGIYLTRERGLRPELAGLVISAYAAGGLLAGPGSRPRPRSLVAVNANVGGDRSRYPW